MTIGYVSDEELQDIADAIKFKDGNNTAMTPAEMPDRIGNLGDHNIEQTSSGNTCAVDIASLDYNPPV